MSTEQQLVTVKIVKAHPGRKIGEIVEVDRVRAGVWKKMGVAREVAEAPPKTKEG